MKKVFTKIVLCLFFYNCLFAETSLCKNLDQETRVLPAEIEYYFAEGVINFRRAKERFDEMKEALDKIFEKNFISLDELRKIFPQEEVYLSDFFNKLENKYGIHQFLFISEVIQQDVVANLQLAKEYFEKTIKYDEQFIDAHIYNSLVCLEMGLYKEAIASFKKACEIGFDKLEFIEILDQEFKDLFWGIATLSLDIKRNRLIVKEEEKLIPEDIMRRLMQIRESALKELIKKTEEDYVEVLYTEEMLNKFELAKFYLKHQEREKAIQEFTRVYAEVKDELKEKIYYEANKSIERLNGDIGDLDQPVIFELKVKESIIKRFTPKITVKFFKQSEYPVCCDIDFYILPAERKIRFKNEGTYYAVTSPREKKIELPADIELPSGIYTCIIELSNIEIIEKDRFPFAIVIENKEKDLRINLSPELHLRRKEDRKSIVVRKDTYLWDPKQGILLDKKTNEHIKFNVDSFVEKVVISNLRLYGGIGKYSCSVIRIGEWPVPGEGDKPLSIVGMGLMILSTLIIR